MQAYLMNKMLSRISLKLKLSLNFPEFVKATKEKESHL